MPRIDNRYKFGKLERLTNGELCKHTHGKLTEQFGPRTYLGKFDLSPQSIAELRKADGLLSDEKPNWAIITYELVGSYKVHAAASSAKECLSRAGLRGYVEDLEAQKSKQEGVFA